MCATNTVSVIVLLPVSLKLNKTSFSKLILMKNNVNFSMQLNFLKHCCVLRLGRFHVDGQLV